MNSTKELLKAVQLYFDSLYFCDTDKLNEVFHPSSSLFDGDSKKIFCESIASFSKDVGSRTFPASKEQAREDELLMIDWLSPLSAVVKVRLRAHENVFIDHLCFVNGWKIVSKTWHLEKVVSLN